MNGPPVNAGTGEVELREFALVLIDLPSAHAEATEKLNEVIQAVQSTKKAGKITISFTIGVGKLDDSQIEILPEVKTAIPRHPLKGGVFFPDEHGNPTKDDPNALWRGEDIRSAPTFRDPADDPTIKKAPNA